MRTRFLFLCFLFSLLLLLPACLRASAHPGKTDAQGGHYDRSTGEYHFHHGYPAHQHEGGTCPYDFDNKTGSNSGSSSSGSKSASDRETVPYTEPTTGMETTKPRTTKPSSEYEYGSSANKEITAKNASKKKVTVYIVSAAGAAGIIFVGKLVYQDQQDKKRRRSRMAAVLSDRIKKERIMLLTLHQASFLNLPCFQNYSDDIYISMISQAQKAKNKDETELYRDHQKRKEVWTRLSNDAQSVLNCPSDIVIGDDLSVHPAGKFFGPAPYGQYTAYVTSTYYRTKLHARRGCSSATIPVNVLKYQDREKCLLCGSSFPQVEDSWYLQLEQLKKILSIYQQDVLNSLF